MKKPKKKFPYSIWRKNRDGKYYLSVRYSYEDVDGKRKRTEAVCNEHTLEAVMEVRKKLKKLIEMKLNIEKFGLPTGKNTTLFSDFVQTWLEYKKLF